MVWMEVLTVARTSQDIILLSKAVYKIVGFLSKAHLPLWFPPLL